MGDYHDLYVQTDTLLLADVFEKYREKCIEIYGLDPLCFYSAPGLAWKAYLKKTGVKLELLADIDILVMIEKGIRGGVCQSTNRYAKANNKNIKSYYKKNWVIVSNIFRCKQFIWKGNVSKITCKWFYVVQWSFIRFQRRVHGKFKWNSDKGYFLEVDIEYPKTLWGSHKDLTFLPERRKLEKVEKFVCSIEDKEKYVIRTRALKQALINGLKFKNVHRVIKFQQKV